MNGEVPPALGRLASLKELRLGGSGLRQSPYRRWLEMAAWWRDSAAIVGMSMAAIWVVSTAVMAWMWFGRRAGAEEFAGWLAFTVLVGYYFKYLEWEERR